MLIALVGAIALAGVPALAASADAPTGSVSVTVTDSSGTPLQGVWVNLIGGMVSGTTDASGQYTFTGVSNGTYSVSAGDLRGVYMSSESDQFDITDASPAAVETLALSHYPSGAGVVTGRFVDATTRAPIASVYVSLAGGATPFKNTQTGADGVFRYEGLAVDVDTVTFYVNGYALRQLPAVDVNDDTTDLGDIALAPLTSTISGHVIDNDGNPVAGMSIDVNPAPGTTGLGGGDAITDSTGYYSTTQFGAGSLAAGSYVLSTGLHGSIYGAQNIPVTVPDATNVTIDVTLIPRLTGTVVGQVQDSTGAPIQGICVFALDPVTRQPGAVSITDANGSWGFSDLTVGSYLFRMRSCETPIEYGASYLGGTTPAEATVVDVQAADELIEDSTTLLPESTISGHVDLATPTGAASIPSGRGVVYRAWQWSGGQWVIFDVDTADTSSTSGDYTIHDLPAGSYRVEFFDQLTGKRAYATQYWNDSDSAGSPTIDGASTITLATGSTHAGIDAHLSAVRPADVPDAVATDSLAISDQKSLTTDNTVAPGQHLTLSLGAEHAGEWVSVWGHSTPTLLADWVEVSAAGTVQVTVPTTFPTGSHRLVAQTADGTVVGWEPLTVSDAAVVIAPTGSSPLLPSTTVTGAKSTTSSSTDTATTSNTDAAASVPAEVTPPAASGDASADSGAKASSSGGSKATSPVVSPAASGLPLWLLVLIVGLGALVVASVIIVIARRARA